MHPRHQIIDDTDFWSHLEYASSECFSRSPDGYLRSVWVDGFIPEAIKNTKYGAEVEAAWVMDAKHSGNEPYRFTAHLSQKFLDSAHEVFVITELILRDEQRRLELSICKKA